MRKKLSKEATYGRLLGGWVRGLKPASWHSISFPKGTGPYDVTLSLSSGAIKDGFKILEKDPLWVSDDTSQCPKSKSSYKDISDIRATPTSVSFSNSNATEARLRFQINVVDAGGSANPIDPIMANGGRN